ncbi:DUF3592 domain-containing protein [Agrococcus sp. SGAir0287]|uniref:DUF3592 domain-containing protein n=1 Tax=Agrococcus sp. SGAir0287 TaxID=2070347 RepID=UPI0015862D76|nr:hypothetical protein [Agrococcus sp. SGAir0287]
MHPALVVLIVAVGLAAMGAFWAILARALRSPLQPHWHRTIGTWQPWQPLRRQHLRYEVGGRSYVCVDDSSRSLPRRGTAFVRYDPEDPARSVVDGQVGPGDALLIVAILCWVVSGALLVLAALLPWLMTQAASWAPA